MTDAQEEEAKKLHERQWRFLEEVFLSNSISAALGHSSTYNKLNVTKKQIRENSVTLGKALRSELCEVVVKHYAVHSVTPEEHVEHIGAIAKHLSDDHPALLKERSFRIGVAQKALNLYLKFLWCAGRTTTPPDCTLDEKVIGMLPRPLNKIKWTKIKDRGEYCQLVSAARAVAGNKTLAEWELRLWPAEGCSVSK